MSEKRLGMLIDLSRCVGCNGCVVACKQENDLPLTKFNTWIESYDVEVGDRVARANVPKQCNHCKNAPCISVCPTGASYRAENGVVMIDHSKCIGCKYCMTACPYSVRWVNDTTGEVDKCTFCYSRTSAGLQPACVSTCITGARMFGDFNDPQSDVSKHLAAAGGGDVLYSDLGLEPSVHYIGLAQVQSLPKASAVMHGGNVHTPYEGR